jgi:hypothetical protein
MHIGSRWEEQEERDEHLVVSGRITLRWVLRKSDGMVWTGLAWLRIGINGTLLKTQ